MIQAVLDPVAYMLYPEPSFSILLHLLSRWLHLQALCIAQPPPHCQLSFSQLTAVSCKLLTSDVVQAKRVGPLWLFPHGSLGIQSLIGPHLFMSLS